MMDTCERMGMMKSIVGAALLAVVMLMYLPTSVDGTIQMSQSGYRLPTPAQYLILSPNKVRPDMEYRLAVTVFTLYGSSLRVRVVLSQDFEEYASAEVEYKEPSTKDITLKVPDTIQNGTHRLIVEGIVGSGIGQPMFHNETIIEYQSKYISLFIQLDRPIYYTPMNAYFRVIGVTPDLLPTVGTMTVYVVDAGGNVVRRWLQQQLNMGVFESEFQLTYPVKPGIWHMRVEAFGHIYKKNFTVEFFYHGGVHRRLEVNVTTPMHVMDTEWGVAGDIYGEHLSGRPATGNATVILQVKDDRGNYLQGEIRKTLSWMTGSAPFAFSMVEIRRVFGDRLYGKEIVVNGSIYDYDWAETKSGYSITKVILDGVDIKVLGRKFRTFKPGIPTMVYFAVRRPDNTHFKSMFNRQVFIQSIHEGVSTSTNPEQRFIIPDDGIVRFQVNPRDQDRRIAIRVWHATSPNSIQEVLMYRFYSPSNSYLSVTTSTEQPMAEKYMVFTVRTNVFVEEVHYMIVAAGNIVLGNTLVMSSRQKTFNVAISRSMSPRARIIAYFMKDGEVINDALNFFVRDTRLHKANLTLNFGKDFSGDTMEITARSEPGSYFFMNGIDYEMYRRGAGPFLKEQEIIEEMATYDEGSQPPFQHVWWYDSDKWDGSVYFPAPTGGIDAETTFNLSGIIAMSDRNLTQRPDWYGEPTVCNRTLGQGLCPNGQCFDLYKTCDGIVDCSDGYDEATCDDPDPPMIRQPNLDLHRLSRFYSDVTWLWKRTYIMPNGRQDVVIDVDKSTNPYVISGFGLHPTEGLAIVEQPAQHDATRVFFMGAELPESCQRGEQLGIRVALFNNLDDRLEVILTLHGADEYRFVMVEDFGYVTSYSPKLVGGDHQIMVMLEPGENRYVYYPIVAVIETGDVTVKLTAYSFYDKDEAELTFSVSMDGVNNGDFTPYLIDMVNQGSVMIPDFDSPVPEMFWDPETPEHLYVPGSESAVYFLFGDIVAPTFPEDPGYYTMDDVLGIPHDSAEGYMFDFGVNLQMLTYLQAANSLTTDVTRRALEYMKSLLMRQYAYMEEDGSYKLFRRDEYPSIWVSAFVIDVLHSALGSEWNEELYIDVTTLNRMVLWLANQVTEDGRFREVSPTLYMRFMNPETTLPDGSIEELDIPLTAYVTITLAGNTRLTGEAKTANDAAKTISSEYLSRQMNKITDPFQMAITAYALQRCGHRDKDQAFAKLNEMRRISEYVYWANAVIVPNPTTIINTVPFMQTRLYYDNLGDALAATSWALMLYLDRNDFDGATPIMKWIETQRNGMMKFSSSQDTYLALQALTQYALRETNRDIYQMQVTIESTATPSWQQVFYINKTNFIHLRSGELPKAYGQMKAIAKGTGYAMLQMEYAQHVEKMWQVTGPDFASFEPRVEDLTFTGRNASRMIMKLCNKWVRPDLAPVSGMAILQLAIPTGFVVTRDHIEELYAKEVRGLKRVRFRDNTLYTFWENVTQQETCFTFGAERWYPVANGSIQHGLNAYEYQESGLQLNTLYDTYTLFHLHICQVCGSYQCPYCSYYNMAPPVTMTTSLTFLVALFASLVVARLTDIRPIWSI